MTLADCVIQCDSLVAGYTSPVTPAVSFIARPGDVLGVRGQNGTGKSTLLLALAGGAKVFSGHVHRPLGVELLHHRQQWEAGEELPLTGLDVCSLTGADVASAPDRVKRLLPSRLDQLSGGQCQLIRLWACLGSKAKLLLLDEPTNSLDVTGIETLAQMVRQHSADRAIVLVSHESDFLDMVCSNSISLEPA